jgi:hypothetical protein
MCQYLRVKRSVPIRLREGLPQQVGLRGLENGRKRVHGVLLAARSTLLTGVGLALLEPGRMLDQG